MHTPEGRSILLIAAITIAIVVSGWVQGLISDMPALNPEHYVAGIGDGDHDHMAQIDDPVVLMSLVRSNKGGKDKGGKDKDDKDDRGDKDKDDREDKDDKDKDDREDKGDKDKDDREDKGGEDKDDRGDEDNRDDNGERAGRDDIGDEDLREDNGTRDGRNDIGDEDHRSNDYEGAGPEEPEAGGSGETAGADPGEPGGDGPEEVGASGPEDVGQSAVPGDGGHGASGGDSQGEPSAVRDTTSSDSEDSQDEGHDGGGNSRKERRSDGEKNGEHPGPVDEGSIGTDRALSQLGRNLGSVWHFDNTDKTWYSYHPALVRAPNGLTVMTESLVYWIFVSEDQTVEINGTTHSLYAGWNLIVW